MKVRANSVYTFRPVLLDRLLSQHHHARDGQRVRVVNLNGAPKCNTMNHCHIEDSESGEFLGMVCCNSLVRE